MKFYTSLGCSRIPESWLARVLKKSKGSGSGRKAKKGDLYEGISDFSEVAAVFDFYEVGAVNVCFQTVE